MKLWVLHCLKILEMGHFLVSHGIPMHVAPGSVGYVVWHFFGRNSEKYFCKFPSWPFFLLKNHMNLEITYCAKETVACFFLRWTQFSGNPVSMIESFIQLGIYSRKNPLGFLIRHWFPSPPVTIRLSVYPIHGRPIHQWSSISLAKL